MSTRIVLLADVHLGVAETQFPHQDLTHAPDLLRRAVGLIQPLEPDIVIVVGDLANMGTAAEYEIAREILQPLAGMIELLIGNHELLKGTIPFWRDTWKQAPYRRGEIAGLPVVFLSSGLEHLPPTQWRGALDDAQHGFLAEASDSHPDQPLLVFCHHPLSNTVRRSDQPMFGLDDTASVKQILTQHRQPVVLFSGHTHYQSVVQVENITCITTPPLCFWPHGFLVVDIRDKQLQWTTIRLFELFQQSPDTRAVDPEYRARAEGTLTDQSGRIVLA